MKKSKLQAKEIQQEAEPTFLRLAKLYWSQLWRAMIIGSILGAVLIPIGAIVLAYFSIKFDLTDLEQISKESSFLNYLPWLPIIYLLQCVLFRLIIGNKYSDFTFTFVPERNRHDPGYMPLIFKVSWAYFWRTIPASSIFSYGVPYLYPSFKGTYAFMGLEMLINSLIAIFFLHFVVNKQYGNVRLSLLGTK